MASRIVPSPDWFVGLDSFNLCIGGEWVDSVAIKVNVHHDNSNKPLICSNANKSVEKV